MMPFLALRFRICRWEIFSLFGTEKIGGSWCQAASLFLPIHQSRFLSSYFRNLSSYQIFLSSYRNSPSFYLRNARKWVLKIRQLQRVFWGHFLLLPEGWEKWQQGEGAFREWLLLLWCRGKEKEYAVTSGLTYSFVLIALWPVFLS